MPSYAELADDVSLTKTSLDRRKFSQGDEHARLRHRKAVLSLAASAPPNLAAALDYLKALDHALIWVDANGMSKRSPMAAHIARLINIAAIFQTFLRDSPDELIAEVHDVKAARANAETILRQLHTNATAPPLSPSPSDATKRSRRRADIDAAIFSDAAARGLIPRDLRLKSTWVGIIEGRYSEEDVRLCGMAYRLARDRKKYDAARSKRERELKAAAERRKAQREVEMAAREAAGIKVRRHKKNRPPIATDTPATITH